MKKIGYIAVTAAAMAGSSVAHAQFAPPPPGTNPTPPWYIGAGTGTPKFRHVSALARIAN